MTEHKFTDEEVITAFDILDKFEFFGGQRAGRELWFNKPTDIQNKDIGKFLRDLGFLKQFINRQKAEVSFWMDAAANAKKEAIKEFAERLKQKQTSVCAGHGMSCDVIYVGHIDALVRELTGGDENG